VLPRLVREPPPDPGDGVIVLPQAVVQTAGAMDLFEECCRNRNMGTVGTRGTWVEIGSLG